MPLNIPLPGDPGEQLVGASQDYRNILHNIMQNRIKQQELAETGRYHQGSLAQQAKELAETTKYHQALVDIQRQEKQRAAEKDAREQRIFNELFGVGKGNTGQQGVPSTMGNQQLGGMNPSQQNYQQRDKDNFMELMNRVNSPNRAAKEDQLRDRNNFIELMNRRNPSNQLGQPQQLSPMDNLKNMKKRLDAGEEIIFRKGDSSRNNWNKFPGYEHGGFKIPKVDTTNINGIRYDTYPNGEIRAQKLLNKDESSMSASYGKALEDSDKILQKYGVDSNEYKKSLRYADRVSEGESGRGVASIQLANAYQNEVARDNPELKTPEDIRNAANILRSGGDTYKGKKLNPLSPASLDQLNALAKTGTYSGVIVPLVRAKQASAEINVLSPLAIKYNEPYATTYANMSPEQFLDTFKTDEASQKRLGKFIAGQQIQFEIAQLQTNQAGSRSGVTNTHELIKSGMQRIKAFWPRLSSTARAEAQKAFTDALEEGLKARLSVSTGVASASSSNKSGMNENTQGKTSKTIDGITYTKNANGDWEY